MLLLDVTVASQMLFALYEIRSTVKILSELMRDLRLRKRYKGRRNWNAK